MIGGAKSELTVEEIAALIEKSSLPTVLVEGKDDIIFYRSVEEDLADLGVDMLPAGNKGAVLGVRERIDASRLRASVVYVVDKDLWVYPEFAPTTGYEGVVTTTGYSIENDVFEDADIISLMYHTELAIFLGELERFVFWYALAVDRNRRNPDSGFRTHAGKILDDEHYYLTQITLKDDEEYPEELRGRIMVSYGNLLRGKSLFALLSRVFSAKGRAVKFGVRQLMEIGSRKKGPRLLALTQAIRSRIEADGSI